MFDISLADHTAQQGVINHSKALLIGVADGGFVADYARGERRFIPVARGRVDWLGEGELHVQIGPNALGRVLLVDIKNLPNPAGLKRTFGDRILFANEEVCVYEEIIGPSTVRSMHDHGPRLVLTLTAVHLINTLPGGEKVEVNREPGSVSWAPKQVTHEVMNVGMEPFQAIAVEHP